MTSLQTTKRYVHTQKYGPHEFADHYDLCARRNYKPRFREELLKADQISINALSLSIHIPIV